jgi:hypothetical protein
MAKIPKNNNQPWTKQDLSQLQKLVASNTPTPLIAYKLERTEVAIRGKAHINDISLKPTNKSPYNRKK